MKTSKWLHGVDKAVVYGVIWRLWQLLAVPVTLYLIAVNFSPEVQGYYFTFASLIALQSFFELGLYLVVVNIASHEWAKLGLSRDGAIEGSPEARSRLISLGRFIAKYYIVASALFIPTVILAGFVIFPSSGDSSQSWIWPWVTLTVVAGLKLALEPFCSLLEGCGQLQQIYQMRIGQAFLSGLAGWIAIYSGWELWATVVIAAVQLSLSLWFLGWRYRAFFRPFFSNPTLGTLDWRLEIWPMQWRLACSGVVNYLSTSLFSPVMFALHGPVVAGQMGMTLQVVGGIQTIALTWLSANVPKMGGLIARGRFRELDDLWGRTMRIVLFAFLFGAILFLLAVGLLKSIDSVIVNRVLSFPAMIGFLSAGIVMNLGQSLTAYLRAHKKEPIFIMSVVTALLIGVAVILSAHWLGSVGVAWTYCGVAAGGLLWEYQIWKRCRREWHSGGNA